MRSSFLALPRRCEVYPPPSRPVLSPDGSQSSRTPPPVRFSCHAERQGIFRTISWGGAERDGLWPSSGAREATIGREGTAGRGTRRLLSRLKRGGEEVDWVCEGCEGKIRKTLETMDGVTGIEVVPRQNRVTVTGYVDAAKVMRRVARKTGKRVEPWPYVPYEAVAHPYAAGAYDRKAPAGYVRDVTANYGGGCASASRPFSRASSTEARYTGAFSDENANAACAIM